MRTEKSHVPKGFQSVTPCIRVAEAARLIEFLEKAFDAETVERHDGDEGAIEYAALRIHGSIVEIFDARAEWKAMPCGLHFYVTDTDAAYHRALDAGATSLYEPTDMPYGERSAGIRDPGGNHWYLATYQPGEGKG